MGGSQGWVWGPLGVLWGSPGLPPGWDRGAASPKSLGELRGGGGEEEGAEAIKPKGSLLGVAGLWLLLGRPFARKLCLGCFFPSFFPPFSSK